MSVGELSPGAQAVHEAVYHASTLENRPVRLHEIRYHLRTPEMRDIPSAALVPLLQEAVEVGLIEKDGMQYSLTAKGKSLIESKWKDKYDWEMAQHWGEA